MGNADAEAFARKLYFKHKSAIRLMDPANWKCWIKAHLDHLILDSGQLQPEISPTEYVRFTMRAWASARRLSSSAGATSSYPHFYFTFYNFEDSLTLSLWVGPSVLPETKKRLLDMAAQKIPPFCKPGKEGKYYYIYRLALLTRKDYEESSDDELKALINVNWQQFLEEDLPEISRALEATSWFRGADGLPM